MRFFLSFLWKRKHFHSQKTICCFTYSVVIPFVSTLVFAPLFVVVVWTLKAEQSESGVTISNFWVNINSLCFKQGEPVFFFYLVLSFNSALSSLFVLFRRPKKRSFACVVISNLFCSFVQSTETTIWLTMQTWCSAQLLASNQFIEFLVCIAHYVTHQAKVNWKIFAATLWE